MLDHDVPARIGAVLRSAGHEVAELRFVLPTDSPDDSVFAHAAAHGLILITCNRDDFLELASTQTHAGLIILIRRASRLAECAALLRLLEKAQSAGLEGNVNFA
jgi:predicted nuclease of predicted toxin-antitoxin system